MNWIFSKFLKDRSGNRPISTGNQLEHSGIIAPTKSLAVVDEPITFTSTVDFTDADVTLPIDYGNTYYISAAMGDNATGVKGNPQKPYATFAAVAALYQDNEVIHILDGVISASGVTTLNDNQYVNIYVGDNATLSSFQLRPSVNDYLWNIQGLGSLISPNFLPATESTDGVLKIEVSYIQSPIIKVTIGKVYIKCNHFNLVSGDQNLQLGNATNIASQKLLQIDCKLFEWASDVITYPAAYSTNASFIINTEVLLATHSSGDIMTSVYNNRFDNYQFVINAKLLLAPNAGESSNLIYFTTSRASADVKNINFNINIGHYTGAASLFHFYGPGEVADANSGESSICKVHFDYFRSTRTTESLLKRGSLSYLACGKLFFHVSGNYIADTVPIMLATAAMASNFIFSGTFKTLAATPAISLTTITGKVNLENAKFIVEATQKVVEATGASNVYCMNVVTNSTTTDAEVTEVGQAIVRNANFV